MKKILYLVASLVALIVLPSLAIFYDFGLREVLIPVVGISQWLAVAVALGLVVSFWPQLKGWRPSYSMLVNKNPDRKRRYRSLLRRFLRHKLGVLGLLIILFFVTVAIFPQWFLPEEVVQFDRVQMAAPDFDHGPSRVHPLGTTLSGADVRALLVNGAGPVLSFAFRAALIAVVVGGILGATAGYVGGWVDRIITMLTETVLAFPSIFIIITVLSISGEPQHRLWLISAYGVTSTIKIVRAEALRLREMDYVHAAVATGGGQLQIIFGHIMVNALPALVVQGTVFAGQAIMLDAYISFLGVFGASGWAGLIAGVVNSYRALSVYREPWLMNTAGACLFLVVISFNYVGDALRDALEVKSNV